MGFLIFLFIFKTSNLPCDGHEEFDHNLESYVQEKYNLFEPPQFIGPHFYYTTSIFIHGLIKNCI